MSKIIVTGFKPFSLLTWCTGNPSEIVASALGNRYGANAYVSILQADATCLTEMASLGKLSGVGGVLMLGASIQTHPVVMETEGVSKADGMLGALNMKIASTGARQMSEFARANGVPTATAPITPLVYWCLRSYAAALEWAEARGVPCIFLHVNTLRTSTDGQVDIASRFFEKMQSST